MAVAALVISCVALIISIVSMAYTSRGCEDNRTDIHEIRGHQQYFDETLNKEIVTRIRDVRDINQRIKDGQNGRDCEDGAKFWDRENKRSVGGKSAGGHGKKKREKGKGNRRHHGSKK